MYFTTISKRHLVIVQAPECFRYSPTIFVINEFFGRHVTSSLTTERMFVPASQCVMRRRVIRRGTACISRSPATTVA